MACLFLSVLFEAQASWGLGTPSFLLFLNKFKYMSVGLFLISSCWICVTMKFHSFPVSNLMEIGSLWIYAKVSAVLGSIPEMGWKARRCYSFAFQVSFLQIHTQRRSSYPTKKLCIPWDWECFTALTQLHYKWKSGWEFLTTNFSATKPVNNE